MVASTRLERANDFLIQIVSLSYPELDLETVYLLDQVQKGNGSQLTKNAVKYLRKHNLVEGRVNSLYLSAGVSQAIDDEASYSF